MCAHDADAVTGPTVRIDKGRSGPAAAPVMEHDLIPPALDYRKWVGHGLGEVARLTGRLHDAIDRGDRAGARTAWLLAHLQYERLGGAYDAFGDADQAINGTDAGEVRGSEFHVDLGVVVDRERLHRPARVTRSTEGDDAQADRGQRGHADEMAECSNQAARASAHAPLDSPFVAAWAPNQLRWVRAQDQARTLQARSPAAHVAGDEPDAMALLFRALRKVGAQEQADALATRAAAHAPSTTRT
ncbi:hypothetical protein AB0I54_38660 [Streptomyces sp. NPDC050625]|uniref:hypothetical protein n=1 Tax=Streptomyces sp. NPDC050625 TaxID=3154629 RepID=UPI0034219858